MPWEGRKSREEFIFRHQQDRLLCHVGRAVPSPAVPSPAYKRGDERSRMWQQAGDLCVPLQAAQKAPSQSLLGENIFIY